MAIVVVAIALLALASGATASLPEGRVFEQVSPEFKAGYSLTGRGEVASNGESVHFNSIGAFAGSGESFGLNPYLSRRTSTGWVTSGLFPQPSNGECAKAIEEFPPDMSRFEYLVSLGMSATECEFSATNAIWVREQDGSFTQASPEFTSVGNVETALRVVASSHDLSRFIVRLVGDEASSHMVQTECNEHFTDEHEGADELFEAEGCEMRLIGVDQESKQRSRYCPTELGGQAGAFGALSQPAGSEVFFSVAIDSLTPTTTCNNEAQHPVQLYARINGRQTLTIAAPLPGTCNEEPCKAASESMPKDAVFQGASEDGSRVFFTTRQPLVDDDKDTGDDLYMATIGCAGALGEACGAEPREVISLTRLSKDPHSGESAAVLGVVAASSDGSHVFVVAGGDLLGDAEQKALEASGSPVPQVGADNLYVYDTTTAQPSYITELCSGPAQSGAATDDSCPTDLDSEVGKGSHNDSGLWTAGRADHEAQTTQGGNFLLLSSYGQLITFGPERDADTAKDVYRYDVATNRLQRVSVGESGADANGNDSSSDASIIPVFFGGSLPEQYELGARAISEDGSRVVFSASGPLSSSATNGHRNVYVWHEGNVGMISSGAATEDDDAVGVTSAGRDVFLVTSAGLTPSDTDGLRDIYDARIEGGFPERPAALEPCLGEVCRGPLSTPSPLLVPGSTAQPAGGNFGKAVIKQKRKVAKKRPVRKRKRRSKAAKGTNGDVRGGRGK